VRLHACASCTSVAQSDLIYYVRRRQAGKGRAWMGKEAPAGTTSPGCTTLAATLASELGVHMPVKDCGADAKSACPPVARRASGRRQASRGALPDAWALMNGRMRGGGAEPAPCHM